MEDSTAQYFKKKGISATWSTGWTFPSRTQFARKTFSNNKAHIQHADA